MHVIFFRKKMEEMMGEWEQKSLLINELTQGRELARQLRAYLNVPSSNQTCELLVQQIQASYHKALSMLDYNHITTPFTAGAETQPSTVLAIGSPPPPFPPTQSPRDNGDYHPRDFREYNDRLNLDESMKRTTLPRWTQQVRLRPGAALEGPLDDGFSWRKYGQKDILGSKYPRWYYRCIHRHVRGCLATKQVQRSDEDPIMFEITYRGTHTCNNRPTNLVLPTAPSEIQEQQGTNIQPHDQHNQQPEENNSHQLITDEIIQAAGVVVTDSTANATTGIGSNFPFANADFDPKLTFDNQGFFL